VSSITGNTNFSDRKSKQPVNTNQHLNEFKQSFAFSYKLRSVLKLSTSRNYQTWGGISENVLWWVNFSDLVIGMEELLIKETNEDGDNVLYLVMGHPLVMGHFRPASKNIKNSHTKLNIDSYGLKLCKINAFNCHRMYRKDHFVIIQIAVLRPQGDSS